MYTKKIYFGCFLAPSWRIWGHQGAEEHTKPNQSRLQLTGADRHNCPLWFALREGLADWHWGMCAVPFLRSGGEQASALSAASREVYAANFALLTSQPSCPTIASLRWSVWWWAAFRPVRCSLRCSLRQAFALQPLLCRVGH